MEELSGVDRYAGDQLLRAAKSIPLEIAGTTERARMLTAATCQRPHYFASVRMYSTRNHSVEVPYNEEGLRNHFLADGSNFLTRTGNEYNEIMPVYDWRKIPGTTVVQKLRLCCRSRHQACGCACLHGKPVILALP